MVLTFADDFFIHLFSSQLTSMRQLFLYLVAALLLGASPAWALNPIANVVVPSGQSTTFTGASVASNANYYQSIEIQNGGFGQFDDAEYVNTLLVRTGGTVIFSSAGEMRSPSIVSNSNPPAPSITLEPGAAVQLANPAGLPFAQGSYNGNAANGMIPFQAYVLNISPTVRYLFNGTAAQTTAAPAPRPSGGTAAASASGIALPGTVGRLTLDNGAGLTMVNNTGVNQELQLVNGQLTVASGATLTLLSTSEGTGLYDLSRSGTLVGNFAVQRYIDNSLNAGTGYRHLSAPVSGQTVASLTHGSFSPRVNAAYNANPASVSAASFPTVFSYDERKVGGSVGTVGFDQGWQSPAALTDALLLGQGFTVNTPPTAAAGATLTFTGAPTTRPVALTGLGHTAADGGFHLLGNPYAAPINWDFVVAGGLFGGNFQGLGEALYVYKSSGIYAGTYTTYVAQAVGVRNSATAPKFIPSGQAFFVYNPTVGASGSVTFIPDQASTSYEDAGRTPVQRTAPETRAYLALTLQDAAQAHAHQTLVYFDAAATTGFDKKYDAVLLPGPGQALSLSTELGGKGYAINGLPALGRADVALPLRLSATAAGTYTLKAEELANLPAGAHAYLLDAATGTRQDLAANPSATITLAANASVGGRYSLLFTTSTALATAPAALAQLAGLYPNPAHGTTALVLPATLRGGQATPVAIVNALGQVVRTATHPATADELPLPLNGLAAGIYTVQAHTAAGTISRRLTVE